MIVENMSGATPDTQAGEEKISNDTPNYVNLKVKGQVCLPFTILKWLSFAFIRRVYITTNKFSSL